MFMTKILFYISQQEENVENSRRTEGMMPVYIKMNQ